MKTIIANASEILTLENDGLGIVKDSNVIIENGKIVNVTNDLENYQNSKTKVIDAKGMVVMPGFVDCHSHLVFNKDRADEFAMRLEGKTYQEILLGGGGILNTVRATREASLQELFRLAQKRIDKLISWGTTTVEIKSGYGLNTEQELKILRVIKKLKEYYQNKISIIPTFMAAHTIPPDMNKNDYIHTIIKEMMPIVEKEKLAVFCDVFCENFVFTAQESKMILKNAKKYNLIPKIHADEIESSGGAEVAGQVKAISAEHLLYPSDKGLKAMQKNDVIAVLLPGTSFFLKSKHIPPIDKMRKLGLQIALGSDFNPGTCMIYQMPIIIGLGCLLYNLSLSEAIQAATINSAKALGLAHKIGSITKGKDADLIICEIPNHKHLVYQFGTNVIKIVLKKGKVVYQK